MFAALLLAAGSLSDRLGRKGFLLAGLVVFGAASIAGGLTDTAGQLIVARCFMGLGAAMIFPTTLSLISNVYTERAERAKAIGLWGATAGIAIALGPIVGGWLLEQFSWTSIFFAMAPVAAVGAALVAWSVPTSRDPGAHKTDGPGLVLSSAAIALLTYTLIEAPSHGWSSGRTLAGFALAAALFARLHRSASARAAEPMLDVSLFRNLRFTAASGSVTVAFFGISGLQLPDHPVLPVLQGLRAALHRRPPAARRVRRRDHVGARHPARRSLRHQAGRHRRPVLSSPCFFAWVSTADTGTSYLEIVGQMLLGGSGVGLVSAPATEAIMGVVPKAKAGIGSAVNDATRLLGSTLGVAVIGSIYVSLYNSRLTLTASRQR